MKSYISSIISKSAKVKADILGDERLINKIEEATLTCIGAFRSGNKVLLCGNGGSASDAQHLAAELSGRFYKDRPPLDAEALHVNTSYLTAVANDYGFEEVFARLLQAKGKKGDVLIGLSTSGKSPNILRAFEKAKALGCKTIALTGETGGLLKDLSDTLINIPSLDTPRIQESHILIGHIICELVEKELF